MINQRNGFLMVQAILSLIIFCLLSKSIFLLVQSVNKATKHSARHARMMIAKQILDQMHVKDIADKLSDQKPIYLPSTTDKAEQFNILVGIIGKFNVCAYNHLDNTPIIVVIQHGSYNIFSVSQEVKTKYSDNRTGIITFDESIYQIYDQYMKKEIEWIDYTLLHDHAPIYSHIISNQGEV